MTQRRTMLSLKQTEEKKTMKIRTEVKGNGKQKIQREYNKTQIKFGSSKRSVK